MKPTIVISVLLLVLVSSQCTTTPEASQEREVRAAVAAFGRAFVEADVSELQSLLTEDYIHVNGRSGGVLTRDAWLKWLASRREELDNGVLVISAYNIEDVTVQLYGDTAVVTGVVHSSGMRNRTSYTTQVRFTNVWVSQGGVWRRAAFHDSPLPESGS